MTEQTQPTDAEILDAADGFRSQYKHGGTTFDEFNALGFARAVLAKWGTPAGAGEPVAEVISTNGLEAEFTCEMLHGHVPALGAVVYLTTPQPTQAQAGAVPLTADELKEPRNGKHWRVEWWNESCRMMLPTNKRIDSFRSYKNGTLMFTIKEAKGADHG